MPYVLVKNTQFGVQYIPFGKGLCALYTMRIWAQWISFIRFEDKIHTFCTLCLRILFAFHIYLNTISYQDFQVAVGQITWTQKGYNLLFVNFIFLCHFLK